MISSLTVWGRLARLDTRPRPAVRLRGRGALYRLAKEPLRVVRRRAGAERRVVRRAIFVSSFQLTLKRRSESYTSRAPHLLVSIPRMLAQATKRAIFCLIVSHVFKHVDNINVV